jgi:hypothetical protein
MVAYKMWAIVRMVAYKMWAIVRMVAYKMWAIVRMVAYEMWAVMRKELQCSIYKTIELAGPCLVPSRCTCRCCNN